MQTKVLQENLAKALSAVSRFSSTRAQLPVLGNILFQATKTKLIISATNLEISASIAIGAQTIKEGELTIPSRIITEVVTALNPGTVLLEAEKEQLKIKTDSFSSNILGMAASDFPKVPKAVEIKKEVMLPFSEFKHALSSVIFSSSLDESRPTLTGVLFSFEKNNLTLVATDGFRLSQTKMHLAKEAKIKSLILPRGILTEISRMEALEDEIAFSFNPEEKQVIFATGETVLASRIIEGEFPNFEKIIPKKEETKIVLGREDLSRAVKLASVFARESANIIKIKSQKSGLKISAESPAAGSQETSVDSKIEGEEVEIAFNFRFLEDFLHATGGEEVAIGLSGPSAPAVFTNPKEKDFLHLIMPVKIQA